MPRQFLHQIKTENGYTATQLARVLNNEVSPDIINKFLAGVDSPAVVIAINNTFNQNFEVKGVVKISNTINTPLWIISIPDKKLKGLVEQEYYINEALARVMSEAATAEEARQIRHNHYSHYSSTIGTTSSYHTMSGISGMGCALKLGGDL